LYFQAQDSALRTVQERRLVPVQAHHSVRLQAPGLPPLEPLSEQVLLQGQLLLRMRVPAESLEQQDRLYIPSR
jgi:hypothetical protein